MAYRRTSKSRRTTRRTSASYRTGRSAARSSRRTTRRRASGGARTIRIVIEQGAGNPVARPPLGMVPVAEPRKASF